MNLLMFDDDSCIAVVEGCTDPEAFNYNEMPITMMVHVKL